MTCAAVAGEMKCWILNLTIVPVPQFTELISLDPEISSFK